MAKSKVYRLGDLQLKIMKLLWQRADSEAAVAEVHQALSGEGEWAYTTIEEVTRKISTHFIDRLFEGSLGDMIAHLLTTRQISREELVRLETLIAERKKKL